MQQSTAEVSLSLVLTSLGVCYYGSDSRELYDEFDGLIWDNLEKMLKKSKTRKSEESDNAI
jgi:ribosome-associated translation inhibitor RaiA